MKKDLLAKIKLNDIEYVCYLDENNKLTYYKSNKFEDIIEVLDIYENNVLNEALSKAMISRDKLNHIKLKEINFNNKLFQVVYDKISGFEFFYEIKNGDRYIPSREDFISLFKIFNYEFLSLKDHEKIEEIEEPKIWFRRTFETVIGAVTVSLFLTLFYNCVYSEIPVYQQTPKSSISKIERLYEEEVQTKQELSIDKLLILLRDNPGFTQEEKELYLGYLEYIFVNKEYFDVEHLYSVFGTASAIYNSEKKPEDSFGEWDGLNMQFYGISSMEERDYGAFVHEAAHSFSRFGYKVASLGIGINEGYAQILRREYTSPQINDNFFDNYSEQVNYMKMMFEILGTKPFTQFQGDGNIFHVIDALKNIIPDEQMAVDLVYNLDLTIAEARLKKASLSEDLIISSAANKRLFDLRNEIKTAKEDICSSLSQYFMQAKGYPMEDDFIMMSYYYALNPSFANDKGVQMNVKLVDSSDGSSANESCTLLYSDLDLKKGYLMPAYIREHKDVNLNISVGIPFEKAVCSTNENGEVITTYITDYNYISTLFTIGDTNRRMNSNTINYGPILVTPEYNDDIQQEIPKQKG